MALTKDRNTVRKAGEFAAYPVGTGAKIFAGSMVMLNAAGYAVPAADTAGCKFLGIARQFIDNTGGANGDLKVEVWRKGCFEMTCAGMAVTDVGTVVYASDDQTVTKTAGNGVNCGRISEFVSATSVYVDIDREIS
jgi:predicted RecA/RadA family phage recombinase